MGGNLNACEVTRKLAKVGAWATRGRGGAVQTDGARGGARYHAAGARPLQLGLCVWPADLTGWVGCATSILRGSLVRERSLRSRPRSPSESVQRVRGMAVLVPTR